MDAAQLIKRIHAQREGWAEVEPGVALLMRRPAETAMGRLRAGLAHESVCACIVGWRGVTEATLLGAQVGAADEVAFDAELCREVLADRLAWVEKASEHLVGAITAHLQAKAAAEKN